METEKGFDMKLSVVIPCYNAANTIGAQLEALSHQQWNYPWEVVVADNGSTDNSRQIVDGYQGKISNLRSIDASQKKGAAYARNVGVRKSRGKYIAFCDADDVIGKNWVAAMSNALSNNDFVACRMEWARLNDFSEDTLNSKVQVEKLNTFFADGSFYHAGGGSLGIKKKVHLEVGGFNEALYCLEDTDYCFRVQLKGYRLTFTPEAVVHIRAQSSNFKIFKQELQWAEHGFYLYKKYEAYGMKNFKIKKSLRKLYYHFRAYKRFLSPEKRCGWVIRLAIELGKIKGAVLYKLTGNRFNGWNKL